MTNNEAIKWLMNLKNDIGNLQYEGLWHYAQAIDEITELLKEQEPRVLTLAEAANDNEVWTEVWRKNKVGTILIMAILWPTPDFKDFNLDLMGTSNQAFQLSSEYGKTWRCWTAKPTAEQRLEAKWG